LVVALTGGIGSGKSTVADRLTALGAGVIDTDLLSRELTASGNPVLEQIAGAFGRGILTPDGSLDRAGLRQLIFQNEGARKRLETILHPPIRTMMLARLASLNTPYAVLVIPLLFETGQQTTADRVLVVDIPEPIQIERVMRRNSLSRDEVERIIDTQITRRERLARADDLIDNSGDLGTLEPQIQRVHANYLRLSASH
jgi:dephospho-CoA kinase